MKALESLKSSSFLRGSRTKVCVFNILGFGFVFKLLDCVAS